MKRYLTKCIFILGVFALTACDPYTPTMKPDYTIKVVSTPKGSVAIPPTCLSYAAEIQNPYDNQPQPQFGCATARNLAMAVERPDDLVRGRDLGPQRGVTAVGAIRRYDNNQTRGLISPSSSPDSAVDVTTATTPNSSMSGDVTAGGGGAAAPAAAGP